MCGELGGQTSERLRPGGDRGSSPQGRDGTHRGLTPKGEQKAGQQAGPARRPEAEQPHGEWAPGCSDSKTLPFPPWLSEP